MSDPVGGREVMRRASPADAEMHLSIAFSEGDIAGYERIEGGRWRIEVQPTRFEAYHYPDTRGVIVLTTREVMAFTEGRWAARGITPNHRAGDPDAR